MCFIAAMYSGALLSNDLPRDSNLLVSVGAFSKFTGSAIRN